MDYYDLYFLNQYFYIYLLFSFIFSFITILGYWKIFDKADKPGWAAIVPIYNVIVLLEVVGRPVWWLILFLIPGLNLVIFVIVYCFDLAKVFGKEGGFGIGLLFLNLIFLMILAFDENIEYVGPIAGMPEYLRGDYIKKQQGSQEVAPPVIERKPHQTYNPPPPVSAGVVSQKKQRPKVAAWLIDSQGRTLQLFQGITTLGKMSENDIQSKDSTVSRRHAKITESNGHFTIVDLGSTNGTRLNGSLIRTPRLLASEDEIQIGDNTKYIFKC